MTGVMEARVDCPLRINCVSYSCSLEGRNSLFVFFFGFFLFVLKSSGGALVFREKEFHVFKQSIGLECGPQTPGPGILFCTVV